MIERSLALPLETLCFEPHKIALLSGPRQCGKTTLARSLLKRRSSGAYHNWDQTEFRRAWAKSPASLLPRAAGPDAPLLVLDEIHKDRLWKRTLKGLYDTLNAPCDFLVTGSARLNVYRRGSDSLLGRFLHFRLHPLSLREMTCSHVLGPDALMDALYSRARTPDPESQTRLASMLSCGPFPEPLLGQNVRRARLWRKTRDEAVIREDLRDISRLPDLARLQTLASLLPERVGSPFSRANLREDLEVGFDTVSRWILWLKEVYHLFEIRPWHRRIPRSLRREGKVYLWDFGAVPDPGARLENLVAFHLLKTCQHWTDTGEGDFELFTLKNKEREEIDFLIVRDGTPWLPVEVKLSDRAPSPNWARFAPLLPCKRGLQLLGGPAWSEHVYGASTVLVAGAAEALEYFA